MPSKCQVVGLVPGELGGVPPSRRQGQSAHQKALRSFSRVAVPGRQVAVTEPALGWFSPQNWQGVCGSHVLSCKPFF